MKTATASEGQRNASVLDCLKEKVEEIDVPACKAEVETMLRLSLDNIKAYDVQVRPGGSWTDTLSVSRGVHSKTSGPPITLDDRHTPTATTMSTSPPRAPHRSDPNLCSKLCHILA